MTRTHSLLRLYLYCIEFLARLNTMYTTQYPREYVCYAQIEVCRHVVSVDAPEEKRHLLFCSCSAYLRSRTYAHPRDLSLADERRENMNGQFAERYNALQPDDTHVSTVTVPCISMFWVDADVEVPPDVVVVARPRLTCDT